LKSLLSSWRTTKFLLLAVLSVLVLPSLHAQEMRIGVVNVERVFREATPAKAATARIEQEFSKREKELQDMAARLKARADDFDKNAHVLPESERIKRQREVSELDKEFQRKQREFREDLSQKRNEEIAVMQERVAKVIRQIGEAEKFDLILQEAVFVSPRADITEKVIKALNAGK
jgi:outer membrane protein